MFQNTGDDRSVNWLAMLKQCVCVCVCVRERKRESLRAIAYEDECVLVSGSLQMTIGSRAGQAL